MESESDVVGVVDKNQPTNITIEGEPESMQDKRRPPDVPLEFTDGHQLHSLLELFRKLKSLTDSPRKLQNAIAALLAPPCRAEQLPLRSARGGKAYEAHVFGLCLRAVRELDAQPLLHGISGTPNPSVFRGAPERGVRLGRPRPRTGSRPSG